MRRTRWRKAPDECGFSNLVGEGDEHGQCCCRWLSLGMRRISITGTCGANKRGFQHDRNTERRTGARARSEHRTKHGDRAGAPFVGGVICPCRAPHGLPYFHQKNGCGKKWPSGLLPAAPCACQPALRGGKRNERTSALRTRVSMHTTHPAGRTRTHKRCVSHIFNTLQHKCTFLQAEHTMRVIIYLNTPSTVHKTRASKLFHRTLRTNGASLRARTASLKPKQQHFCCLQRSQCCTTSCSACRSCRDRNNIRAAQYSSPSPSASSKTEAPSVRARAEAAAAACARGITLARRPSHPTSAVSNITRPVPERMPA